MGCWRKNALEPCAIFLKPLRIPRFEVGLAEIKASWMARQEIDMADGKPSPVSFGGYDRVIEHLIFRTKQIPRVGVQ